MRQPRFVTGLRYHQEIAGISIIWPVWYRSSVCLRHLHCFVCNHQCNTTLPLKLFALPTPQQWLHAIYALTTRGRLLRLHSLEPCAVMCVQSVLVSTSYLLATHTYTHAHCHHMVGKPLDWPTHTQAHHGTLTHTCTPLHHNTCARAATCLLCLCYGQVLSLHPSTSPWLQGSYTCSRTSN